MTISRRLAVVAAVVVLAPTWGCARGRAPETVAPDSRAMLEPRFGPAPERLGTTATVAPASGGGAAGAPAGSAPPSPSNPGPGAAPTVTAGPAPSGASASTEPSASPSAAATAAPVATSFVEDDPEDRTTSPDPSPPWADLLGARLTRNGAGFELRVRLGGGAAPARASDAERSMNIATFADVDGDGGPDYQLWLNLADDGWYAGYFPPAEEGPNRFGARSGVTVTVEGDEVVARFPASHLGASHRFRWSVASEWGRHEVLGTPAAAADDAPDDDGSVPFDTAG